MVFSCFGFFVCIACYFCMQFNIYNTNIIIQIINIYLNFFISPVSIH